MATVLDSVHGYGSSSTTMGDDNIGSLWRMVQDLKEMDAAWRESVEGPNHVEQSIYVFILGHVCSEIFLFHHEKNSRLHDMSEDEVEGLVKELRDRVSDSGATLTDGNLNIDGKKEDENFPVTSLNINTKLLSSWDYVSFLADNLVDLRKSLCEVASQTEKEIDGGKTDTNNVVESREKTLRDILDRLTARRSEWSYARPVGKELECYRATRKWVTSNICFLKAKAELLGRWRSLETREKTLRDILNGLQARRSERSYAPPVGKELECYREIRKWVTSNICFIKAKAELLGSHRSFISGSNFASNRNQIWNNWESILNGGATSETTFRAPRGHRIALIFDESSDFRSLLSIWRRRFSDIAIARSSQEESIGEPLGIDSLHIKVDELKTAHVRLEPETENKKKHDLCVVDPCKPVIVIDRLTKKTRYEYLMDIFLAFVSMGYSSRLPHIGEFRLYTRILEHLQSYIWLSYNGAKMGDIDVFAELLMNKEEEIEISEADTWIREKKTREQYLQEIVSMVDVIESEYFMVPPSPKEWLLYERIRRRANMDLRQSSCYLKEEDGEGKTGSAEEEALARCVLKFTCAREIELASGLEKEIEDTLGKIFAGSMPMETKLTEWLREHMEDAENDMKELATKDSRGFKLFDSALLSLLEIQELFGKLLEKFMIANDYVYHAVHKQKLFQVSLMEGLTSLPWLEEASQ